MLNDNTPSRTEQKEEDFLVMGQGHIHVMLHLHNHPVKRCSLHFTDEVTEAQSNVKSHSQDQNPDLTHTQN